MPPKKKPDPEARFTVPNSYLVLPRRDREPHSFEEVKHRLERLRAVFDVMEKSGEFSDTTKTSLILSQLDMADDQTRNLLDHARTKIDGRGGSDDQFGALMAMAGMDEPELFVPPMNATPAAAQIVNERSLDINEIPGTMPGGKVNVDDVQRYLTAKGQQDAGGTGEDRDETDAGGTGEDRDETDEGGPG